MQSDLRIKIKIDKDTGQLKVIRNEFDALDKTVKKTDAQTQTLSNSMMAFTAQVGGIYTISRAFESIIKTGFVYNKNIEDSIAGLTALTVATSSNISAMGKHLSISEKYNLAQKEAIKTAQELAKINAQTPYTLDETNRIYKAMYVSMKNAGASTQQMINLTKKISIAAGAAHVEFNQLLAGVDGLATGTVLTNSDFGRILNGLGLTNKKLKESSDVVGLLTEKFKDFKAVDTMMVAISNLDNAWSQLTGDLTKSSFDIAKQDIKSLTSFLSDNRDGIITFVSDVERGFDLLATRIDGYVVDIELAATKVALYNAKIANAVTFGFSQKTKNNIKAYQSEIEILKEQSKILTNSYKKTRYELGMMPTELIRVDDASSKLAISLKNIGIGLNDSLVKKTEKAVSVATAGQKAWKNYYKSIGDIILSDEFTTFMSLKEPLSDSDLKSVENALKKQTNQYINYYDKIGDLANEWKYIEQKLRAENTALTEEELKKLLSIEKTNFYDKKLKLAQDNAKKEAELEKKQRYEYLKLNGTIADGIVYQLDSYNNQLPTAFESGMDIMRDLTSDFNNDWQEFFDKQDYSWKSLGDLGKSILKDLDKQFVKTQLVQPLTSATSSLMGSLTGVAVDASASLWDSLFSGWADGGYTYKASSDKTPVGVVHANEYVINADIVRRYPALVAGLEAERRGLRGFWSGGSAADDATSSGFGGTGNGDSMGGMGNASGGSGDKTSWGNNITQVTVQQTTKQQPATVTVVDLDPNTSVKGMFHDFDAFGNPLDKNGNIDKGHHVDIGKSIGTFLGWALGFGVTKSQIGAAASGKVGGALGSKANIGFDWGAPANLDSYMDATYGAKASAGMTNTKQGVAEVQKQFEGWLSNHDGSFATFVNNATQEQIDSINETLVSGYKADVIDATSDLWDSMIGVIPALKADATEEWGTLFNNYIEQGNSALTKVALDGSMFDTPDFYSTWEEYAKNLNESVENALKTSLSGLTDTKRDYNSWLYDYNGQTLAGLAYKKDYTKDDLDALEKSYNISELTLNNFNDKMSASLAEDFTPENIKHWNDLENVTKAYFDAQKSYTDAVTQESEELQADFEKKVEEYANVYKDIQSFTDSWYGNIPDVDLSFEFYADRYNQEKQNYLSYMQSGDYESASAELKTLESLANSLKTSTATNPYLLDSVTKSIYDDFTHFANGGIVTSPTYSLIGEAGYPEAVIPMKNGRDIPVRIDQSAVVKELEKLRKTVEFQSKKIAKMERVISRNEGERGFLTQQVVA